MNAISIRHRTKSQKQTQRSTSQAGGHRRWVVYTALAFLISWTIWAPAVLGTVGLIEPPLPLETLTPVSIFIGAFGPLTAALIMSTRRLGGGGVGSLLRSGVRWRTIGIPALAVIFLLPFLVNWLARVIDGATGGSPPPFAAESVLFLVPLFVVILLLGGPVQEEFGWRGFALPGLRAQFGEFGATAALGAIWIAWHLPFWAMEGSGMAGTPLPVYAAYMLGLTAVMTWLFLQTSGSVLAAILMHTTANWISNVLPTHSATVGTSNAYLIQALVYLVIGAALLTAQVGRRSKATADPTVAG